MKLNNPPDPLIEQALDKFAAEKGLTRIPRATLSPPDADGPASAAVPLEPHPDSASLSDPSVILGLKDPPPEAHNDSRTKTT